MLCSSCLRRAAPAAAPGAVGDSGPLRRLSAGVTRSKEPERLIWGTVTEVGPGPDRGSDGPCRTQCGPGWSGSTLASAGAWPHWQSSTALAGQQWNSSYRSTEIGRGASESTASYDSEGRGQPESSCQWSESGGKGRPGPGAPDHVRWRTLGRNGGAVLRQRRRGGPASSSRTSESGTTGPPGPGPGPGPAGPWST
jgi:hypothetical protein